MESLGLGLALLLGMILLLLNVGEILYLRRKQRAYSELSGQESWLIGVLMRSTLTTATVAAVFIGLLAVRLLFGQQSWAVLVSTPAVLALLLIPVLRGIELRRHEL